MLPGNEYILGGKIAWCPEPPHWITPIRHQEVKEQVFICLPVLILMIWLENTAPLKPRFLESYRSCFFVSFLSPS